MLSKEEKKAQAAVLRLNFPVSSGVQHRAREWQPVTTGSATSTTPTVTEADNRPQPEVSYCSSVSRPSVTVCDTLPYCLRDPAFQLPFLRVSDVL